MIGVTESPSAPDAAAPSNGDIEIVVIVPVFRHSIFLGDAVDSACAQITTHAFRVLIVDDGCPFEETRRVAMTLAAAYPARVEYIRTRNGGLSAARNAGVDYAIARWPSTRAFYFLDADNLIEPHALQRAFEVLTSDCLVGWAFPDIPMFGSSEDFYDYSGPYSAIRHLWCNVSEAASMVRREVFERGCRFDENMRQGYEDWEFWWQCLEAGFVGRHVPFMGLRYRKRPESMLSGTNRAREWIIASMRRKHPKLFRGKTLLAMEAKESPRYAVIHRDNTVEVRPDARGEGERIGIDDFVPLCVNADTEPYLYFLPQLFVSASDDALESLKGARLDSFVFWWLERQLSPEIGAQAAAIEIVKAASGARIKIDEAPADYWPAPDGRLCLMATGFTQLKSFLEDPSGDWANSLHTRNPGPRTQVLRIEIPDATLEDGSVIDRWLDFFQRLRAASSLPRISFPVAKPRSIVSLREAHETPRKILECGPLLAIDDDKTDVAFVTPSNELPEEAMALAARMRARGWRRHLVLLGPQSVDARLCENFDGLLFLKPRAQSDGPAPERFLGSRYPQDYESDDARAIEGLLLPMDAVVNIGCDALHPVLARLKRAGVVTAAIAGEHAHSTFGREIGQPALTLGYEHVHDVIACPDQGLHDWCHAQGAPQDKLALLTGAEESLDAFIGRLGISDA